MFVDDPVGADVRDLALEAVADLDADLAVLGEDEQDEPVVKALAADLPGLEGLDRPILDGDVLARRPADLNEDLVARLPLVILQPRVEGLDGVGRRQEAGLSVAQRSGAGGILAWAAANETASAPAKARMTSGRRSRVKSRSDGPTTPRT